VSGNESVDAQPEGEGEHGYSIDHAAAAIAAEPEHENVPVAWTTVDAPPDPPAEGEAGADAPPSAPLFEPGTTVRVVYRGGADVADMKGPDGSGEHEFRFRNGEPVDVPSEVAEELLTWPGEQFEVVRPEE
jgi:hypothetical protein